MRLSFKRNVGNFDKFLRITGGVLLTLTGLFNMLNLSFILNLLLVLFSIVILLEGIVGY